MTPQNKGAGGLRPNRDRCVAYIVTHPVTAKFLLRGHLAFLVARGFKVYLLSSPGKELDEVGRRDGVTCVPVSMSREIRPLQDLVALLRISWHLMRLRPHIVNAGTPKAGFLGMVGAWLARIPHRVFTLRGLRLETSRGWRRIVLMGAERTGLACATKLVSVSESLRSRYLDLGLTRARKIEVLGTGSSNGVDTERFSPAGRADRSEVRLKLDLRGDALVVGYVGRLTRDKGIEDLAAAFERHVLPTFPAARLLIMGAFEPGDAITKTARKKLDDNPALIFTGFVEDPAPYYHAMDVLAIPSRREGFPNAVLEAAASEVPVVGYAATGTVDAVVDGVTGTLVPVGKIEQLGEALCDYLGNPELRRRHGAVARLRVIQSFQREQVWRAWEDLYCGLTQDRRG